MHVLKVSNGVYAVIGVTVIGVRHHPWTNCLFCPLGVDTKEVLEETVAN
jgi:hypothetical protein